MFFMLSIVLLSARHLSALDTGLWILPFGVAAIFGAGMGIGLAKKFGAKQTVTIGMMQETFGLFWVATQDRTAGHPAQSAPQHRDLRHRHGLRNRSTRQHHARRDSPARRGSGKRSQQPGPTGRRCSQNRDGGRGVQRWRRQTSSLGGNRRSVPRSRRVVIYSRQRYEFRIADERDGASAPREGATQLIDFITISASRPC